MREAAMRATRTWIGLLLATLTLVTAAMAADRPPPPVP